MTARITFSIGSGMFTLETETLPELADAYSNLGGDESWLRKAVLDSVQAFETGSAMAALGSVFTAKKRDPWGDDDDAKPSGAASEAAKSDTYTVDGPFGTKYTMNLPEAPTCRCGDKAAKVAGRSQAGNNYVAWRCAKGAGDSWKSKCDYSEKA